MSARIIHAARFFFQNLGQLTWPWYKDHQFALLIALFLQNRNEPKKTMSEYFQSIPTPIINHDQQSIWIQRTVKQPFRIKYLCVHINHPYI